MVEASDKAKHKPSAKHTLEEVRKSLEDLVRNQFDEASPSPAQDSVPQTSLTTPPRLRARSTRLDTEGILRSLKGLIGDELTAGTEERQSPPSPLGDTEPAPVGTVDVEDAPREPRSHVEPGPPTESEDLDLWEDAHPGPAAGMRETPEEIMLEALPPESAAQAGTAAAMDERIPSAAQPRSLSPAAEQPLAEEPMITPPTASPGRHRRSARRQPVPAASPGAGEPQPGFSSVKIVELSSGRVPGAFAVRDPTLAAARETEAREPLGGGAAMPDLWNYSLVAALWPMTLARELGYTELGLLEKPPEATGPLRQEPVKAATPQENMQERTREGQRMPSDRGATPNADKGAGGKHSDEHTPPKAETRSAFDDIEIPGEENSVEDIELLPDLGTVAEDREPIVAPPSASEEENIELVPDERTAGSDDKPRSASASALKEDVDLDSLLGTQLTLEIPEEEPTRHAVEPGTPSAQRPEPSAAPPAAPSERQKGPDHPGSPPPARDPSLVRAQASSPERREPRVERPAEHRAPAPPPRPPESGRSTPARPPGRLGSLPRPQTAAGPAPSVRPSAAPKRGLGQPSRPRSFVTSTEPAQRFGRMPGVDFGSTPRARSSAAQAAPGKSPERSALVGAAKIKAKTAASTSRPQDPIRDRSASVGPDLIKSGVVDTSKARRQESPPSTRLPLKAEVAKPSPARSERPPRKPERQAGVQREQRAALKPKEPSPAARTAGPSVKASSDAVPVLDTVVGRSGRAAPPRQAGTQRRESPTPSESVDTTQPRTERPPVSADDPRALAVQVIAKLNTELRKCGERALDAVIIDRLQHLLREALAHRPPEAGGGREKR